LRVLNIIFFLFIIPLFFKGAIIVSELAYNIFPKKKIQVIDFRSRSK